MGKTINAEVYFVDGFCFLVSKFGTKSGSAIKKRRCQILEVERAALRLRVCEDGRETKVHIHEVEPDFEWLEQHKLAMAEKKERLRRESMPPEETLVPKAPIVRLVEESPPLRVPMLASQLGERPLKALPKRLPSTPPPPPQEPRPNLETDFEAWLSHAERMRGEFDKELAELEPEIQRLSAELRTKMQRHDELQRKRSALFRALGPDGRAAE